MFGPLRLHSNPKPSERRDGFDDATNRFRTAAVDERKEISDAIEAANEMLVRAHASITRFFTLSKADQMDFVEALCAHASASRRTNPRTGLGFDLYKLWLVANIERDREQIDKFLTAIRQ